MTLSDKCAVCKVPATQKCSGCKNVVYCCREHQKEDWKAGHKKQCKCYEIAYDKIRGRHLRATRDIKRGEVVLNEKAYLIGPKMSSEAICLGCHQKLKPLKELKQNYYKCSKCSWPLCGKECEKSLQHQEECELMSSRNFKCKINFNPAEPNKKESAYCVIMPLRCLLLKKNHQKESEELWALEDHVDERLQTPLYKVLSANLITFIKTILNVNEWSERDIMRSAAILDTNTFDIVMDSENIHVRGLYMKAAMFSHDCTPNAEHLFDEAGNIIFFAKTYIEKGEIISISYTQPFKSTIMRRLHLQEAKCFPCSCARCEDPEELGTFAGSTICRKCKIGKFISTNPLNNEATWKCQICNKVKSKAEIINENQQLQNEIKELDRNNPEDFENFIYKYRASLHETNTHILQVKYALVQLYVTNPNEVSGEISDAALARKKELCFELLRIANVLDNGWGLFRKNILLHLHETIVFQAERQYANKIISDQEFLVSLKEAYGYLLEAADIMDLNKKLDQRLRQEIANIKGNIKKIEETLNTDFTNILKINS